MSFSQTLTDESTFDQTNGITIGAEVSTKAKIPLIGSATVKLSTEYSHTWSYGGSNSIAKQWTAEIPVSVPAGKVYVASISVTSSTVNIPYTGTAYF